MAQAIGHGEIGLNAPGVLGIVLDLVVEDVGGDVERGLRETTGIAKQEIGP